jgi:hypothetical protein
MLSSQTPLFSINSVIAITINASLSERRWDLRSSYICMPSLSSSSCAVVTS